ncbi:MAG: sodium/solute symporter [Oscillospiraceae bacterium]|nr:sodium/solute symporter [Oscillospiraceae bacterium]MDD7280353.1 sodium/solute symporter [Oscillospiraceae bacterium]MDY2864935.1 sodium/solute symporter [Oscillospiraceae bacterium]
MSKLERTVLLKVLYVILAVYLAVMIGIGVYCHKKTSSVSDFVLGGRSVGGWITAFAYGTSYFSAVVFIGYAGQFGWSYGVSVAWIGIGNAVIGSMLAWMVLGKRTRIMSKHMNASTMPEFFEKRFDSKGLKTVSAIIVFIFLIPYTASVYNGLSRLFGMAFNIPYSVCIIAMALLTAVYVILGGYKATAINDFIQGIIMLAGIAAVVICVIAKKGGLSSALDQLGAISDTGIPENTLNSLFGPDPINLIGVVILTSLGTWGLPQMVQKFYAIKDDSAIKRGTVISTLFALVVAGGSYLMGGFGRLYGSADEAEAAATGRAFIERGANGKLVYDSIVPEMLREALPELLIGIVVVLVLSASMSTLSSLVLTSSSTLTIDLIKPNVKGGMDDKKQVLTMRILIAAFLVLSVVIALNPNTYISTLMSISWGALAGAFLAPFMYGLFSKKITKAAVWTSFVTGVGITVVHMFIFSLGFFPDATKAAASLKLNMASPINAGAIAMIVGLIVVPLVSSFTKVKDTEYVDKLFEECGKELNVKALK